MTGCELLAFVPTAWYQMSTEERSMKTIPWLQYIYLTLVLAITQGCGPSPESPSGSCGCRSLYRRFLTIQFPRVRRAFVRQLSGEGGHQILQAHTHDDAWHPHPPPHLFGAGVRRGRHAVRRRCQLHPGRLQGERPSTALRQPPMLFPVTPDLSPAAALRSRIVILMRMPHIIRQLHTTQVSPRFHPLGIMLLAAAVAGDACTVNLQVLPLHSIVRCALLRQHNPSY